LWRVRRQRRKRTRGGVSKPTQIIWKRICRLLIIGDWGPEPLNAEQRRDLLEIVDDRDCKGAPLITSQFSIGRWHEIIGDPTLGDAILDRIVHRAHRIELKGETLQKRQTLTPLYDLTNTKEK
jgi:DNA replication protein DnaC